MLKYTIDASNLLFLYNLLQSFKSIRRIRIDYTLSLRFVSQIVFIEPVARAGRTIQTKDLSEHLGHNAIRQLHLTLIVALGAWHILQSYIMFADSV